MSPHSQRPSCHPFLRQCAVSSSLVEAIILCVMGCVNLTRPILKFGLKNLGGSGLSVLPIYPMIRDQSLISDPQVTHTDHDPAPEQSQMPRWIVWIPNCNLKCLNSVPQDLPQTHAVTRRHCPQTMTPKGTGLPAPSLLPQMGVGPVSCVPPPTKDSGTCQQLPSHWQFLCLQVPRVMGLEPIALCRPCKTGCLVA